MRESALKGGEGTPPAASGDPGRHRRFTHRDFFKKQKKAGHGKKKEFENGYK